MAVAAGSREPAPLAPVHCTPQALPSASASNCPSVHHHERGSPMKNRKREICTSGSVRDEDGQPPHLLGRRNFLHLAAGAAALPVVSRIAWAQAYPTRPVRLLVGFSAGGNADTIARPMGQWLSERLGQPFVIENRPGAGTNIATEAVVRAPADGYTLLMVGPTQAINATLYEKLNFILRAKKVTLGANHCSCRYAYAPRKSDPKSSRNAGPDLRAPDGTARVCGSGLRGGHIDRRPLLL